MKKLAETPKSRLRIIVKGIVQGVGFRPFVYNLACSLGLKGFVNNSSKGVTIEVEGEDARIFLERLEKEAPPLAQIMSVDIVDLPHHGYSDFRIIESADEGSFTLVSADVSICDDCLREMRDSSDRRYLYPFINCTNCGPRYSITRAVPYDRPNTTMSPFVMCPECAREYHDPANRRFHAQPNACHVCGPQVTLVEGDGKTTGKARAIAGTIELLKQGKIVAIKGLGGFHIACDAENPAAVRRLRQEKRRSNKPFALMSPDIETIRKFCEVSLDEENLLVSNRRPIVLLKKKGDVLPEEISPLNPSIGFMLPYTPLHYLLFYHPMNREDRKDIPPHPPLSKGGIRGGNFDALVMTSGNISEEPIVTDNKDSVSKLFDMVDAFLLHDREIFMRVDDSVTRVFERHAGEKKYVPVTCLIRRSRGFVPDPIRLHEDGPEVLGCGADLKNTFTLTKGSFAIPSQHIGDMENYETLKFFEESLANLKDVYRVKPECIAYDLHPMYLSTQWAMRQEGIRKVGIQHHYAHVASVMAEKGMKGRVIGVSFDGTGYGTDGNLWGGEFLIAGTGGFERAGHFKYIPLPGGERAVKEPWRIAVSLISDMAGKDAMGCLKEIGFVDRYGSENIANICMIMNNRQFSPFSSGAGRLFDGISALIGLCDKNTFEGEAAIALEASASAGVTESYVAEFKQADGVVIGLAPVISEILADLRKGEEKGVIAAKFHNTIVSSLVRTVRGLSMKHSIKDVILCGGVFQNMYLLRSAIESLEAAGMHVLIHDKVPTNDAGISLGQAFIIRERLKRSGA